MPSGASVTATANEIALALENLRMELGKPWLRCQSMIGVKMLFIVAWSNVSMPSRLKWRRKRCVTWLRPPPGGPIAATITMSSRCSWDVSFLCNKTQESS